MPVARTGIAKRYAEAVFQIARDRASFDRWAEELEAIARTQQQPALARVLANPAVGMSAKESLLAQTLPDLSPEAKNLVKLLLHKGRLPLASQIAGYYRQLLNRHRGIATAHVVSAIPLGSQELEAVARHLSAMVGKTVQVEPSVDPSIIGGVVAQIGDQLIDGSVRGRLEALKRRLAAV